ncbi:MAG: tyrosine-protein phosphatase [Planctomycetes bacterium]|nr:tyrosine-protein phosphatase [Planctomycetota bacterium]
MLATIALGLGAELYRVTIGSNVHTVVPGLIYRAAQPSGESLKDLARSCGIHTVVNLRGCGNPFDWYVEECRAVQDAGIAMEDLSFSANRTPSVTELRRLVEVIDRTDYPILFHCRRGADRTGMASVIAMLLKTDAPLHQARRQLGPRYGHVPFAQTAVLDGFFDQYERWLQEVGRDHCREAFRAWILSEYGETNYAHAWEEFTPLQDVIRCGEPCAFRVRVRNTGRAVWHIRAVKGAGTHLGYQIFGPNLSEPLEGRAGMLDRDVSPGQTWEVTLVLPPFSQAGSYRLLVDLVEEKHCWFFQAGAEPHEQELIIRE